MSSISYNYQLVLEKIIKSKFAESFKIGNGFDNYISMMTVLGGKVCEIIRNSIVEFFEELDNKFKHSDFRKKNYYYKDTYPRTLITIFGEIRFNRTYYYSKNGDLETGFFYVDKILELPRRDNYDQIIKSMLMEEKANHTYAEAARIVSRKINDFSGTNINISRQLVFNIFNDFEIDDSYISVSDKKIDSDILYIMLDEKFVHTQGNVDNADEENFQNQKVDTNSIESHIEQKHHSKMVKHAVVYTGREYEYKNRIKLVNKAVFSTLDDPLTLIGMIESYIDNNFSEGSIKTLVGAGDGANWINSVLRNIHLTTEVEKITVLDPFHVGQAINRITTNNDERTILKDYVSHGKRKEFIQLCNILLTKYPERKSKIELNKNYLLKHWVFIRNQRNKVFLGCPMEAQISHNLAKVFARDPKGYKVKHLYKHIKLRDLQLNNSNIKELYLYSNGYLPKEQFINPFEREYKSNIPAIETGRGNTSKNLKYICHHIDNLT